MAVHLCKCTTALNLPLTVVISTQDLCHMRCDLICRVQSLVLKLFSAVYFPLLDGSSCFLARLWLSDWVG